MVLGLEADGGIALLRGNSSEDLALGRWEVHLLLEYRVQSSSANSEAKLQSG